MYFKQGLLFSICNTKAFTAVSLRFDRFKVQRWHLAELVASRHLLHDQLLHQIRRAH